MAINQLPHHEVHPPARRPRGPSHRSRRPPPRPEQLRLRHLLPGGAYSAPGPYTANNDDVGAVLKCGTSPALSSPYQMELAISNGVAYLDLSAIDGDPFLARRRHAQLAAGLCVLDCPPGSTACEFPKLVTCNSQADATLTVC
ncbi:hypothetical protein F4780DRAFT_796145 [Xylariomycetidae sp. FL0641]|nr:hypothetical protein F4780DRAFT_796145 [Xylariomycetidae sp. FL0641]